MSRFLHVAAIVAAAAGCVLAVLAVVVRTWQGLFESLITMVLAALIWYSADTADEIRGRLP